MTGKFDAGSSCNNFADQLSFPKDKTEGRLPVIGWTSTKGSDVSVLEPRAGWEEPNPWESDGKGEGGGGGLSLPGL